MGENVGGQTDSCRCKAKAGPFCTMLLSEMLGADGIEIFFWDFSDYTIKTWDSPI